MPTEAFFINTERLVIELREFMCGTAAELNALDDSRPVEEYAEELRRAICTALADPCTPLPIYDPRLVPESMRGIGGTYTP